MKRDLHFTHIYKHPVERVWKALTDSRALAAWLMENDFQPKVGHKFSFRADPQMGWDGKTHCEVLACDPPRFLSYSWKGGPLDTIISYTLEPVAAGTKMSVTHSGFNGIKAVMTSFILQSGWKKMFRTLVPDVLDQLERGATVIDIPKRACHKK